MICDRCGVDCTREFLGKRIAVLDSDYFIIRDIYRTRFTINLCNPCGKKADSFVNYWGKKKEADIIKLNLFLRNGAASKKNELDYLNSLMNAGYT